MGDPNMQNDTTLDSTRTQREASLMHRGWSFACKDGVVPGLPLVALLVLAGSFTLLALKGAEAHQDPPLCPATDVALGLQALEAPDAPNSGMCSGGLTRLPTNSQCSVDGDCAFPETCNVSIAPGAELIEGQTISYRARLLKSGLGNCAFEKGTICIDPPHPPSVVVNCSQFQCVDASGNSAACSNCLNAQGGRLPGCDVTPRDIDTSGDIPCIGGQNLGIGCDQDTTSVASNRLGYTTNRSDLVCNGGTRAGLTCVNDAGCPRDSSGAPTSCILKAQTNYLNGESHQAAIDVPGLVGAGVPSQNTLAFCGDGMVDDGQGEQCEPTAIPMGCAADERCLANCTCEPLCGNGIREQNEECDPTAVPTGCASGEQCGAECTCEESLGCRVTGGGTIAGGLAEIVAGKFGGQVGAPCACIGCVDNFEQVEGSWQYHRKHKSAALHAKDYNSLVCRFDAFGGPEPPRADANIVCFTGVADFTETSGRKTEAVAFRVDAKDRGEPGRNDEYRIRIWRAGGFSADVARQVCCQIPEDQVNAIRQPNIDDRGPLIAGNLQIHPEKTSGGSCRPCP